MLTEQLLSIPLTLLLHVQGGIQGAWRVIFVGDGRAEQSKDAIAQGLGHIPFIPVHGVHHELQSRIDEAASFFGVEVFDEGGGVFDVGKEGSDGLALAVGSAAGLHGCSLGQDMFSQMSRRIANRSRVRSPKSFSFSPFRLLPCGERAATLTAELKSRRALEAAVRAAVAELRPTLAAEFHSSGIFKVAMW